MAIYHPPTFINRYLQEKLALNGFGANPMYPTMPTDPNIAYDFTLDQLTGDDPSVKFSFNGSLAIYDRMLKMRRNPFPHIKSEQLLYYFYAIEADAAENLIETTQMVQDLLDREDQSAQDLNTWIAEYQLAHPGTPVQAKDGDKLIFDTKIIDGQPVEVPRMLQTANFGDKDVALPFFHRIRVYQLEETRDLIDFGTARTYAGNKIIIDYDWHKS